jgi:hypothetical protein
MALVIFGESSLELFYLETYIGKRALTFKLWKVEMKLRRLVNTPQMHLLCHRFTQ